MKIGDKVFVKGTVDEIRKDVVIIRNEGGYFGTVSGEIIDKYAEQEPCDDVVSRQAVLDNIKNGFHWESVNGITAETVLKQVIRDVEIMPSVQPKLAECVDAVNRQAVLDRREILRDEQGTGYQAVKTKYIRELPSVQPKRTSDESV